MNKTKKKIIIYGLLGLVIAVGFCYFSYLVHRNSYANKMVLFYSESCPHCRKVEEFMTANNVMSQLPLMQEQVENNIPDVTALAKRCNLDLSRLQIPLLWTGQQCIVGDKSVIDYFKQQLKSQ